MKPTTTLALATLYSLLPTSLQAQDWPMWGGSPDRNMVAKAKNLPIDINTGTIDENTEEADLSEAKNVKWAVKLGSQTYGNPVVSGGVVLVGTNNESPRDKKIQGDRGNLMAFDEKTGKFLWQLVVPKLGAGKVSDWEYVGICSSPAVEGDHAWLVTNRGEILCLDMKGLANGNDGPFKDEATYMSTDGKPVELHNGLADIIWKFDMREELGVFPHNVSSCSPLIVGDILYTATSNGMDWSHENIPNKKAPALVSVNKKTGELLGEEASGVSTRVLHASWSSPAYGKISGKEAIVWGGGDGYAYAFDMETEEEDGLNLFKELWKLDLNLPEYRQKDGKPVKYATFAGPSEIIGTTIIHDGLIYVMIGQDPEHGDGVGRTVCLDGKGEIVWSSTETGRSISTMAVHDGLAYAVEYDGDLHCFDAKTGKAHWKHETLSRIWGSPFVADGKVWLGTEDGELHILQAGKELKSLATIEFEAPIYSSPVVANDTIFIATQTHLYAIGK